MLKANSAVPAAITAYHEALACAEAASSPLAKLGALWHAFEHYVEPHVLYEAVHALKEWPIYQQALQAYAALSYPSVFAPVERPPAPSWQADLADWHRFLWPEDAARLSVCLLVRNARETLPAVLAALHDLGDECLILDTGSEDGTWEWLQTQPGLTCFKQAWASDFSGARNTLLDRAEGDWVFCVDADEILLPAGATWLRAFTAYFPLGWQMYAGEVWHEQMGSPDVRSWASRLFRHDLPEIRFTGALHEVPVKATQPAWLLPVWSVYQLKHSGNLPAAKRLHRKAERVAWLEDLVANEQQATPYLRYQLAHVLAWGHDTPVDLPRARVLLDSALAETLAWHGALPPRWDWVPAPLPALLLLRMQVALWLNDMEYLLRLAQQWGHLCPYREADILVAMASVRLGNPHAALEACYHAWLPGSWSLGPDVLWQKAVWEVFLDASLLLKDGLLALFAVRRLQELAVDASPHLDLSGLKAQLEQAVGLRPGEWLNRLQRDIQICLRTASSAAQQRLAWLLMAGLTEVWRQDWLCLARALFEALAWPQLAEHVAGLERLLFRSERKAALVLAEGVRLSAGEQAYWRWLLEPPLVRPRRQAALMVRNAADTLSQALVSASAWVDSFLIVDTGSEDATPELIASWAQTHEVQHWQMPWPGDFSVVRQALLGRAEGEWLLMIDADDVLEPTGLDFWRRLSAYRPPQRQLFAVRYVSLLAEGQSRVDWAPRLVHPQAQLRYWGRVHEQPGPATEPEIWPTLPLASLTVRHSGYLPEAMERHHKVARGHWLPHELSRHGFDNPYFCYQYAAWLAHHQPERLEAALACLLRGLDSQVHHHGQPPVAGWFPLPLQSALVLLVRLLTELKRPQELVRLASPWVEKVYEPEFFFWLGMAALRNGQQAWAYQHLWRAGNLPAGQLPQAGFHSWRPALALAELALQKGDWSLGIGAFQRVFAVEYAGSQSAWQRWWEQMNQVWNSADKRSALA
ncbi:MAG: glycosyltransferase [Candidatus Sericytochromatia bacterium]